jgi:hypothetical protein
VDDGKTKDQGDLIYDELKAETHRFRSADND